MGNICMVNLLTGKPLVVHGTNFSESTQFGPFINFNTGGNGMSVPAVIASESFTVFTGAIMFYVPPGPTGGSTALGTSYTNTSSRFSIDLGTDVNGPRIDFWNGGNFTFTPALPNTVVGHYYFLAISVRPFKGSAVLVDLNTGRRWASTCTNNYGAQTVGTAYNVGTVTGPGAIYAWLAAVMMGNYYVPQAALLKWAQDPWAFWYPRTIESASFVSARGTPVGPVAGSQARAVVMA